MELRTKTTDPALNTLRVLGPILANEVQGRTRGTWTGISENIWELISTGLGSPENLYQGKTLEISIKRGRGIIMTMPNLNLISLCVSLLATFPAPSPTHLLISSRFSQQSHRSVWCFRKRGSKQRGRKWGNRRRSRKGSQRTISFRGRRHTSVNLNIFKAFSFA